jgi:hypothetical protein
VLLDRIGRLFLGERILLDEGPLQASWAIFYEREFTEKNRMALKKLLTLSSCSDLNIYVYTDISLHEKFVSSRERKHPLSATGSQGYTLSTLWMKDIIFIQSKKKSISVINEKNKWVDDL